MMPDELKPTPTPDAAALDQLCDVLCNPGPLCTYLTGSRRREIITTLRSQAAEIERLKLDLAVTEAERAALEEECEGWRGSPGVSEEKLAELEADRDRLIALQCEQDDAILTACKRVGIVQQTSPEFNEPVADVVDRLASELAACRAAARRLVELEDRRSQMIAHPPGSANFAETWNSYAREIADAWRELKAASAPPPPNGAIVDTKIDDERGVRNEQRLTRSGSLWFFPDHSMYVYYTPTHWRPCQ